MFDELTKLINEQNNKSDIYKMISEATFDSGVKNSFMKKLIDNDGDNLELSEEEEKELEELLEDIPEDDYAGELTPKQVAKAGTDISEKDIEKMTESLIPEAKLFRC